MFGSLPTMRNQRVNGPQNTIHTRAIGRQSRYTRRNASDHISRNTLFFQMKWYLVVDDLGVALLITVYFPLIGPVRATLSPAGIPSVSGGTFWEEQRPGVLMDIIGESVQHLFE